MTEMPHIIVLKALKDKLFGELDGTMVGGKLLKVRHHRHRESKKGERNCLALRYISHDVSDSQRGTTSTGMPEEVWDLAVNLVVDVDLPAEPDALAPADEDPTGYGTPSAIVSAVLEILFPDGEVEPINLDGKAWDMHYDGTDADEGDSGPDFMRIEERLTILYRVRADRPTVLLTGD